MGLYVEWDFSYDEFSSQIRRLHFEPRAKLNDMTKSKTSSTMNSN